MDDKVTYLFGEPKVPKFDGEKKPYTACNIGHPRRYDAFVYYYKDWGSAQVVFYNYVMRVYLHDPTHLLIETTEGVYLLQGENLDKLLPLLKERELDFLHCFSEERHIKPDHPDTILLTEIAYLTRQEWAETGIKTPN